MRGAGVIHLPGDRHREGVMLTLSVRENVLAARAPRGLDSGGFVRRARERRAVAAQIERLGVKTPSAETSVAALSGGNQQKVLFARALLGAPRVLLADEPTRGVDAGARIDLYQVMRDAAADGRAVLVLSSDAVELQGLCDRVLVFSRGRIVRELEGAEINEENITGAAVTSDHEHHRGELAPSVRRAPRLRRFVSGDYLPSVVLAALIVIMAVATEHRQRPLPHRATACRARCCSRPRSRSSASASWSIILTGNFDLSVGPLMGLMTVVVSFFWGVGQGTGDLLLGDPRGDRHRRSPSGS